MRKCRLAPAISRRENNCAAKISFVYVSMGEPTGLVSRHHNTARAQPFQDRRLPVQEADGYRPGKHLGDNRRQLLCAPGVVGVQVCRGGLRGAVAAWPRARSCPVPRINVVSFLRPAYASTAITQAANPSAIATTPAGLPPSTPGVREELGGHLWGRCPRPGPPSARPQVWTVARRAEMDGSAQPMALEGVPADQRGFIGVYRTEGQA